MAWEKKIETNNTLKTTKVIGEVSKGASWVKEGMKFEHSELFLNGLGQNWNSETPLPQNHIVKIMCPTCKTFH